MAELRELENKMKTMMALAKECADTSLVIIKNDSDKEKIIYKHWENFLVHFFNYVKAKEKETGQDILKGITVSKLFSVFLR